MMADGQNLIGAANGVEYSEAPDSNLCSQRIAVFLSDDAHKKVKDSDGTVSDILESAVPGAGHSAQVGPLITSLTAEEVDEMVQRAASMDPSYRPVNFRKWYLVRPNTKKLAVPAHSAFIPDLNAPSTMQHLAQSLHALRDVESACHLQEAPPPAFNPNDDPLSHLQGYLEAAPKGIDARYAWNFPGGTGIGVGFVDMEAGNGGWNLNHEDLVAAKIQQISGFNTTDKSHGTGVLGVILMTDNQVGGIGIATNATARVISQNQIGGVNGPDAIMQAARAMSFGDVLLLEAQAIAHAGSSAAGQLVPLEAEDPTFDAIRLATALGITVIQPAANGGVNLDTYRSPSGKLQFNRNSPDFKESNAIIVGAGSSTVPHTRMGFSSYGSRVDLYGWGENVETSLTNAAGTDNKLYVSTFNGTSSASSIVAGAALIVQGIAQNHEAVINPVLRYSPTDLRRILASGGTPTASPSDLIGVMPNLRAIINGPMVNLPPDIYIRDAVGDFGNPGTSVLSVSPDIIVRQDPIPNPQLALGVSSGTGTTDMLSQDIARGKDHYVYVRVLNRGGGDASNVTVTVFFSPPSPLITPDLWTKIGTATLPSVPHGNVLTVSPAIKWPVNQIPVPFPAHYCFTAIAGTTDHTDPGPFGPDLATFDKYIDFVSKNNNMAFSNFEIISAPPVDDGPIAGGGGDGFHHLPFIIPGAFDSAKSFAIETLGSLPLGAEVQLTMPYTLGRQLNIHLVTGLPNGTTIGISLPPMRLTRVGEGVIEQGSKTQCEMKIKVPWDTYWKPGVWEFAIRQIYQGREVGRLTWHFGQPTKI